MVTDGVDRRSPADGAVRLTPAQLRSRRLRNIALGLTIALLVVLFYVMTLAKLGGSGVISTPN